MTAQEKAKELFMRNFEITVDDYCAKQCALVAVEEVQQLIKDLSSCKNRFIYIIDEMNYWQEVKKEIKQL
jgi:hypothetical protein